MHLLWLGIDDEKRLMGMVFQHVPHVTVSFTKGMDVVVVGGGDTAAEEATYLR